MLIKFTINGELYSVNPVEYPADITLNSFIRNRAELMGTKFMCLEGGCGACVVTIRGKHPVTKKYSGWAANSCLVLLVLCDGWDIITIEGLGNKSTGYHPIQKKLAYFNGSQCGYCSPGMVMTMYSLLEAKHGKVTMAEVENSFGGNLCRCTGYRPILDAMKSLAIDADCKYSKYCEDIEDLGKKCLLLGKSHQEELLKKPKPPVFYKEGHVWYFPKSLYEIFSILQNLENRKYILVAGNTSTGVYHTNEDKKSFIEISCIPELHKCHIGDVIELGANITLTKTIKILTKASKVKDFEYCSKLAEHLGAVSSTSIRNMATIAGNLMIKHEHHEFPSDIFIIFATIRATIYIAKSAKDIIPVTPIEFLNFNMHQRIIVKVSLPKIKNHNLFLDTYKITPRVQNSHAYVNAGFLIQISRNQIIDCNLCYGGINPTFVEAISTSKYLIGKTWIKNDILENAIKILSIELNPDSELIKTTSEYRKILACGLFYKYILKNTPSKLICPRFLSGGSLIERPLSSGTQIYTTNEKNWPLTKPIPKLDILFQCSGEATYMNDLTFLKGQLWAAFVHATEIFSIVRKIDPTDALKIPGVVAFYSSADIPGNNSFVVKGLVGIVEDEEIFCSRNVKYHSQPVGIIVAETQELANLATTKVKISYEFRQQEIRCTLKDALLSRNEYYKNELTECENNIISKNVQIILRIKGNMELEGQYHFPMETLTTVCIPDEDELVVHCSGHFLDLVHVAMSCALNIPQNKINFISRRIGGSYGIKDTRPGQVAIACALAAKKLNRPVRFVQSLQSCMASVGKRCGTICFYDASINRDGIIQNLSIQYYVDLGCNKNDSPLHVITKFLTNCYNNDGWNIKSEEIHTDAPSHTWCRASGTLEGIAIIENIMEHISRYINRDPVDVRMDNIPYDSKMRELLSEFLISTEYRKRKYKIENFNTKNRWRKKGIAISLMRYPFEYDGSYPATVTVYHHDGTIAISHGGIEMGQGLNTKVAQVAAYTLGVPLSMITIKSTNNFDGANSSGSHRSFTSNSVCSAVKGACEIILERMEVAKSQLKNPTWIEITKKCYELNISLIANHMYTVEDINGYEIWGLACTEIEVDILTGNCQLNRVDILEDTGESMSPLIDVGQIEGSFVMGIGYWLKECLIYDRRNGELLTNNTWNYKIPGAKDIPVDFRITLYQKRHNPDGFLRSKATGEPAICLSIGTIFALRHALDSAREEVHLNDWYMLGAPTTPENIVLAAGHKAYNFTF